MLGILVGLYRKWPYRAHCRYAHHALPCRVATAIGIIPDWCKDVPGPIPD